MPGVVDIEPVRKVWSRPQLISLISEDTNGKSSAPSGEFIAGPHIFVTTGGLVTFSFNRRCTTGVTVQGGYILSSSADCLTSQTRHAQQGYASGIGHHISNTRAAGVGGPS
jgi:hypothetical protein